MSSGRHVVSHSQQLQINASTRNEPRPRRYRWLAILTISAVLAALGVGLGARTLRVRLTSGSANSTLFGVSASSLGDLSQARSQFGRLPIVRIYYPGLPSPDAWTSGTPGAAHSAVVVSFKALPNDILSGRDDAALSHFFKTAPTGHPIYWCFYHEPEDNIEAGQFSAAGYKAAWSHIAALADQAHNPYLKPTLILMAWDLNSHSGRNWRNYLPTGGIISTLGWDAYPAGSVGAADPRWESPASFTAQAIAASKGARLPFGFAEFGLATTAGRPGWLLDVASYMRQAGAVFGTYFDSSAYRAMNLTDAASITAWRSVVQNSNAGGPPPTPTPKPTPSQPKPASKLPQITGLTLSPAAFPARAASHTTVSFTLTRHASITVCVLNSAGAVVRRLDRPDHMPGRVSVAYYGYDRHGRRLTAGSYTILVVASNIHGSGTAEAVLKIIAP